MGTTVAYSGDRQQILYDVLADSFDLATLDALTRHLAWTPHNRFAEADLNRIAVVAGAITEAFVRAGGR